MVQPTAIDDRCREAGGFVVGLEYDPGRASTEPKRLGLLVECAESLEDESVPQFPDLARLFRLHLFIVSFGRLVLLGQFLRPPTLRWSHIQYR